MEASFRWSALCASTVLLALGIGLIASLWMNARPLFAETGVLEFLTGRDWAPNRGTFGALRPIAGTLLTTLIAGVIAVPVAVGIAVFLTELCPFRLRSFFRISVDLLAAIPSIVYGLWGFFSLSGHTGGVSILTASIVLAVMIIPFTTGITREAFHLTSITLKESACALGATRWEVIKDVVIPNSKGAIISGVILALGRALGETMAVAYVIGNSHHPLQSLKSPYTTITATIANEFNEADDVHLAALFSLGLVLLVINLIVFSIARRLMGRRT